MEIAMINGWTQTFTFLHAISVKVLYENVNKEEFMRHICNHEPVSFTR